MDNELKNQENITPCTFYCCCFDCNNYFLRNFCFLNSHIW